MDARKVYQEIASAVQARRNCTESGNTEWFDRHEERIEQMTRDFMPSGSGFDSGTKIDLDASHGERLVFTTSYHHMNDGGYYDGWTEHTVVVTPSFSGISMRISGRNRNEIKDHMYETFDYALCTRVVWDKERGRYIRETVAA